MASQLGFDNDKYLREQTAAILERITGGESPYKSPTDMGVNRVGFGIMDDEVVREASRQEVIRRFFRYSCEYAIGFTDHETVQRTEWLMEELGVKPEDRKVVAPARQAALEAQQTGKGNEGIFCGAAIELKDGSIMVGKNSPLMHAASSLVLNAIKKLAELPDKIHLLSPNIMASIATLKRDIFRRKAESLNLEETLIALSISSTTNPMAQMAMEKLKELSGCEMHMTHIPVAGRRGGPAAAGCESDERSEFPEQESVRRVMFNADATVALWHNTSSRRANEQALR